MMKKEGKYYGDIVYLDLDKLIDIRSAMQIIHLDFYEYYSSKLGIDTKADPILMIAPFDIATLHGFLSDVLIEYQNFGAKNILGIENPN
jgi:hypothetical protein